LEGSISIGRFHDRWTGRRRVVGCEGICARRPSFSGTQRGSSGTARAPGLVSASMTTRLELSWKAGDPVGESSPHSCRWRRLEWPQLVSPFRDPLLAAESLRIRPGQWNSFFPAFPRLHQRDINQHAVVHPPAMIYCTLELRKPSVPSAKSSLQWDCYLSLGRSESCRCCGTETVQPRRVNYSNIIHIHIVSKPILCPHTICQAPSSSNSSAAPTQSGNWQQSDPPYTTSYW